MSPARARVPAPRRPQPPSRTPVRGAAALGLALVAACTVAGGGPATGATGSARAGAASLASLSGSQPSEPLAATSRHRRRASRRDRHGRRHRRRARITHPGSAPPAVAPGPGTGSGSPGLAGPATPGAGGSGGTAGAGAGGGSGSGAGGPGGGGPGPLPTRTGVDEGEYYVRPTHPTVGAGSVELDPRNLGQDAHDLSIRDAGNNVVASVAVPPGSTQTVQVDLAPGTYTLFCSLYDHEQLGMHATLIVR